jgi:uncharacterized protein YndB with AHSA1/START domain
MRVIELPTPPTTLRVRIEYPTLTPADVYARWTVPELLCQWWSQTAESEAQVGGAYSLSWPAIGRRLYGEYLAVVPNRELRFTWNWAHEPEDKRTVAVWFAPLTPSGTTLTLEQGPYAETPDDQEGRNENHLAGWRYFLPRLDG